MPLAAAPRPIVPLWAAVLTSVVSTTPLTTAFPALSWWPMAFPAVVLALIGLVGRRVWSSVLVGFAFGAAFFFVNLIFTARYLGPVPWIALSMLEALLTAAHSGTIGRGAAARGTRQSYAGLRTAPARRPRRQRGSDRAVCHDAAADRIERLARGRGKRSVCDERELVEQVDRLLRPAHEVARSHVGLDQHPLQRHSARP